MGVAFSASPAWCPIREWDYAEVRNGLRQAQDRLWGRWGRIQTRDSRVPKEVEHHMPNPGFLIREAYLAGTTLNVSELYNQPAKGSPAWINSDRCTIDAKADCPQSRETI